MKKIIAVILILFSYISANIMNNPSYFLPANPNFKSLNGYKSGSDLSGVSIFGDLKKYKENPYGLTIFNGGLNLGFLKSDYKNYYSLGYGLSLGENSILSAKYTTTFSTEDDNHFDMGLLLAYRYINLGIDFYDISINLPSWIDSEKNVGITGFLLNRRLFLSTYGNFSTFDVDNLNLTNSIGYKFSRGVILEGYLNYNTFNFSETKNMGLTGSLLLTPLTRFNVDVNVAENFDDGYDANTGFVFFRQMDASKKTLVKYYVEANFPSKFVKKENLLNSNETYRKFFEKLLMASSSPAVKGIVLRLPISIREGLGLVENFRSLLQKFKDNGKEVFVYLENGGSKEFFLASVANSIYLNPSSYNIIKNPYLETIYYKGLLDKLGIKFEYIRYAKYKSAIEPYAFDSMSTYARANKKELIDDMIKNISNKKIDFKQLSQKVLITPKEMIDSGYVDDTLYWDQVIAKISKKGMLRDINKINFRTDVDYTDGKIVIVNFDGVIIPGRSIHSVWGSDYVGSNSFTKLMNALNKNSSVKGIIIKMNSPGGSASASDIIYHSIENIHKPVYTFIEGLGASGGFYSACGSDKIYASPSSIVGSIGIYAGKIDANGLFGKLGLKNEKVMSGKRDDIFSITRTWSDEDYKILNHHLRYYYDRFLSVVAKNRKMDLKKTEELAGGRIYSGTRGLEVGLIDEVSDLSKVIKDMKLELGGLNVGVSFVKTTSLENKLMNSFIPSLKIDETIKLIDMLEEEDIYMIAPNLSVE